MRRATGIALMKRALTIMEKQWPEMAAAHMRVPLEAYRSEEIATRERELFETSPLALLAASEIANPHDYLVRRAAGRSILLTRDGDGVAHAFLNYCRHRGAEPVKGCGNARAFACPYHAWTYRNDGSLAGVPGEATHYRNELDRERWRLPSVAQLDTYRGLIFATWNPDAPPLLEELGALRTGRERWDDDLRRKPELEGLDFGKLLQRRLGAGSGDEDAGDEDCREGEGSRGGRRSAGAETSSCGGREHQPRLSATTDPGMTKRTDRRSIASASVGRGQLRPGGRAEPRSRPRRGSGR